MSEDAFTLPPGSERFTCKVDRLAFRAEPGGSRRLTRIARVAHVEQTLSVTANLPDRQVVLRQRYDHPDMPRHADAVRVGFAPEEARHIAACLIEAAAAVEAGSLMAKEGGS